MEDQVITKELCDAVGTDVERALRVWSPPGQVSFGPQDVRSDGYEAARGIAESNGYSPVERRVGGRAVAYTGQTVAFAFVRSLENPRVGLEDRYEKTISIVAEGLVRVGASIERGEPPNSFCSGTHSLRVASTRKDRDRGKICGVAQRIWADRAMVAGCIIVVDNNELAEILAPVYGALSFPFDPASIGSVERAGGTGDPALVQAAVIDAFRERWETL